MKRFPELKSLSSDHHRALVLAKKAKKAGAEPSSTELSSTELSVTDVWSEMERYYSNELEIHFKQEEDNIAPHLQRIGKADLLERLVAEHKELRSYFMAGADRTVGTLNSLGRLLEQHVRFEERELFNVVQDLFSQEELTLIEEGCRK